ncbi:MAG TPA: Gfo/Idh/MocA family oxidoreductase [Candidatus Acidoferrum sp.]|nr:Gfo/Idh/MocA family oxidoreductase [Candidatus Acidoferrum sp.]
MTSPPIRVAVVGTGEFGRNHVRVWRELEGADLVGIVDANFERAAKVAAEFGTRVLPDLKTLAAERVQAVSVAVPTKEHARVGCELLAAGHDVLVEKPMASSLDEADALIAAAKRAGKILQIGHVERFNPAVAAAQRIVKHPLFFEVHRLGVFTPRSLDIDVVYDVMIHDLDILLTFVDAEIVDVKAVGIPVITDKVDIAHARLEFDNGTVANLTASRVSTERVRKMRLFQEHEYISMDFARQDVLRVRVQGGVDKASIDELRAQSATDQLRARSATDELRAGGATAAQPEIGFEKLTTTQREPLKAELESFLECVRSRRATVVDGTAGRRALAAADRVMEGILDHARRVKIGGTLDSRPNGMREASFTPQETR